MGWWCARFRDSLVRDRECGQGRRGQPFESAKQGGNHQKRPASIRKIKAGLGRQIKCARSAIDVQKRASPSLDVPQSAAPKVSPTRRT